MEVFKEWLFSGFDNPKAIAAQIIGIIPILISIFIYTQNTRKKIVIAKATMDLFLATHLILLETYTGALLNIVVTIRNLLFLKKEKLHMDHIAWLVAFCAMYFGAFLLTFTVFGQEPTVKNLIIECLPVIGMVSTNLAFRHNEAKIIRRFGLVSSCSWLIYNVIAMAVGAILCEVFSLVSIFIAMYRFDRNTEKSK